MRYLITFLNLLLFFSVAYSHDPKTVAGFETWYERSGFLETPRYDETVRYCRHLATSSPFVHYSAYGVTPQGREIPMLVLDFKKNFTPHAVQKSGNMVLLIQACIHPGEPDGKDAGLMLLRDIAIKHQYEEYLNGITLLFIPIVNPDGHERFGQYNRINQNGPKEMGWRVTAQNLNLNRDHVKADAPEMRAWLRLFSQWMPDFFIDIHTTDGADYQYALTYALETLGSMDEGLTRWQKDIYEPAVTEAMANDGFPVFQYVQFRNWHDPRSGLRTGVAPPMLSQGYTATRNRPGLLIETHMLKDYKTRVTSTYHMLVHTIQILHREQENLKALIKQADEFTASIRFRQKPFPLTWRISSADSLMVDFLGVEYETITSEITNGPWFIYHPDKPRTYTLAWFSKNLPTDSAMLPEAYIIPVEWSQVIDRLSYHGIEFQRLQVPVTIPVSSYRFSNVRFRNVPYEGRQTVNFDQEEFSETRTFLPGSALIDMNQPAARLIAHMFEPKSTDSFLYWGFFNAIFEQKEYAETYVMEKLAREMLASDNTLRIEFDQKKSADPEFAKNQWAMLNWLYSKSPYWDHRKDVYPVGRIHDRSLIDKIYGR